MAIIGYARAGVTGQGLDEQLEKLKSCDKIFQEKKKSGAERPQFEACLKRLREGDTLVVTRLDRLARSTMHLYRVVDELKEKGVALKVLANDIDTGGKSGQSFIKTLGMIREFETGVRAEQQAEGARKARRRGAQIGVQKKLSAENMASLRLRRRKGESIETLMMDYGLSRSSVYRYSRENKNKGHAWQKSKI